jgi:hypothetical protein
MIRSSEVRAQARRLERAVAAELAEYDTARARLRDVPDAARLGAALDRRGLWQPVSSGGNPDTDELAHRVSVAASMHAGIDYIDALAGLGVRKTPRAHPCDLAIVCDVHTLCLPAGLDTARYDGIAVQTHPGKWRRWSAPSDAQKGDPLFDRGIPAPADLPHLMTVWEQRFARPAAWSGVHPVIHAAMATFALARIVPFQNGNRRAGQLLAHGLLNRAGVPFTGVTTAMQRDRHGLELALTTALDRDDAAPWCRAVAIAVADVVMTAPDAIATLDRHAAGLAADMPAFPARLALSRHDIALDLLTRAVDTPRAFATRHGLSRDAATRILRQLRDRNYLEVDRLNGHQIIRLHRAQACDG